MNAVSVKREATKSNWRELAEKMAEVINKETLKNTFVETTLYSAGLELLVYMEEGKEWFGISHRVPVAMLMRIEGTIKVRHDKVEMLQGAVEAFAQEYQTAVKIIDVDRIE